LIDALTVYDYITKEFEIP